MRRTPVDRLLLGREQINQQRRQLHLIEHARHGAISPPEVLFRRRQPATPPSITTPDALCLKIEPMADCGRYDSIRKIA